MKFLYNSSRDLHSYKILQIFSFIATRENLILFKAYIAYNRCFVHIKNF